MEQKYKSLSIFDFQNRFKTSEYCLLYLSKESPTTQTLFRKIKLDIIKALYIIYFVITNRKKESSLQNYPVGVVFYG